MAIQSLDELRSALEKTENGQDVLAFFESAVQAERLRGETEKTQANNEARNRREQLKKVKAALQKLGYQDGADVDEFADELAEKIGSIQQGATPSGDQSDLAKDLAKLKREFDKTRKELERERQTSSEVKVKAAQRTIRAKLADALRDKVMGHEYVIDSLIANGKVSLDEDSDTVVWRDGEDVVDFDQGTKAFLDKNQSILRNQQTAGARSPTSGSGSTTHAKYNQQQLEAMSQEEARADWPAVKASWDAIRAAGK